MQYERPDAPRALRARCHAPYAASGAFAPVAHAIARYCGTQANTFVLPLPSNIQPAAIIWSKTVRLVVKR